MSGRPETLSQDRVRSVSESAAQSQRNRNNSETYPGSGRARSKTELDVSTRTEAVENEVVREDIHAVFDYLVSDWLKNDFAEKDDIPLGLRSLWNADRHTLRPCVQSLAFELKHVVDGIKDPGVFDDAVGKTLLPRGTVSDFKPIPVKYENFASLARETVMYGDAVNLGRIGALMFFSYRLVLKAGSDIHSDIRNHLGQFFQEENLFRWINDPKSFEFEKMLDRPDYLQVYKKACAEGTRKVYRLRVMIVGQHGVGKTSLRKRLLDEGFSEEYKITDGIDVDPSECVVDVKNSSVWLTSAKGYKPEVDEEDPKEIYEKAIAKVLLEHYQEGTPVDVPQMIPSSTSSEEDVMPDKLSKDENGATNTEEPFGHTSTHITAGGEEETPPSITAPTGKQADVKEKNYKGSDSDLHSQRNGKDTVDFLQIPANLPQDIKAKVSELKLKMEEKLRLHRKGSTDEIDSSSLDEPKLKLSFWDFGGQHVFYTTHQTFLTSRAIYLLVMDLNKDMYAAVQTFRQGRTERVVDLIAPKTGIDYLDYWLNSIHTHAVDLRTSTNSLLSPPVIIVCTHKDQVDQIFVSSLPWYKRYYARYSGKAYYSEDPESVSDTVKSFFKAITEHLEGKVYNSHVYHRYFAIDNKNTGDPALEQLRQTIFQLAQQQQHWGEDVPIKWLNLERQLREIKQSSMADGNFLPLQEVIVHGSSVGMTEEEVIACLVFYHEVGEMVFFNEDHLREIVILDPQWLIDAFKSIITLKEFHKEVHGKNGISRTYWEILDRRGILHEELVDMIWEEEDRLIRYKIVILQLMQSFDLICPLKRDFRENPRVYQPTKSNQADETDLASSSQTFFVPCLLSSPSASDIIPDKSRDVSALYFRFSFLPNGLFYRLVACAAQFPGWHVYGKMLFHGYVRFEVDEENKMYILVLTKEGDTIAFKMHLLMADLPGSLTHELCRQTCSDLVKMLNSEIRKYCPRVTYDLCVKCNCEGAEESTLEPIGYNGQKIMSGIPMLCHDHHQAIRTTGYRPWFVEWKEEDVPKPQTFSGAQDIPVLEESLPTENEEEFVDEVIVKPCLDNFYDIYSNDLKEVYKNTSTPRGRSLIINNRTFNCDTPKLANRHGTELDVDKMEELLHQLGYRVSVHHDLTAKGMSDLLKEESERPDHQKYDSFILVILSHGARGAVYGTDGFVISYEQITEYFNNASCSALRSKPKMIFIQACQGNARDHGAGHVPLPDPVKMLPSNQNTTHDAPEDEGEIVPTMADFLVAKATTPDFVSWRNKEKGTWFIQSIVTVFCRYAWKEDVLSMFSKVNALVAKSKTSGGMKQVSQTESTLLKKIYFFPGK
ncbi:uncharacterized protein LOC106171421 [Lingula anatina]|uniref:Uncharacterized protein LOC106171421 n=1 Tax=Lingula anatina TaxID=7574 RepID=A0A1S3J9Z2_LINAN|nr:uncharacterized protein LOC106171421 [Lingula anatina]XP_013407221.1 uncharacterized protein LOC106171421 [Lingula anatina]|eukprot:XP_013407220.1 uncharacterized protein LOC106171421 [Lingula anatina]